MGAHGKTSEIKGTWPAFASFVSGFLESIEEAGASKPFALDPGLYLVATPIGNLGDITLRALWVLRTADAVLCEDTRVGGKLLSLYGIRKPLISLHEHNEEKRIASVLERLEKGAALALISDAGTPLVSDPGFRLVRACRAAGHAVFALPGASALLAATTSVGLEGGRFLFAGFLPNKSAARKKELAAFNSSSIPLVFYESPQRLAACLADMASVFGAAREGAVCRELTKLHEEVRTGTLGDLAASYAKTPPKGEIVILCAAAPEEPPENWEQRLEKSLKNMSLRDAVAAVAAETGVAKGVLYRKALFLTQEN